MIIKMAIEIIKTPWYKMIKVKRTIKRWNKKYADRSMTIEATMEAIRDIGE